LTPFIGAKREASSLRISAHYRADGGYQKVCVWGHNLEIEEND
jgi:hypothetical protein